MKVLQELSRENLLSKFSKNRDFGYISWAIHQHKYCFSVYIDQNDLKNLTINSSPKNPQPPTDDYPTVEQVLDEIKDYPGFLMISQPESYRGLNGAKIKAKLENFKQGNKPEACFIMDWTEIKGQETYYIIDGMHRLVAYAISSGLNSDKFPITVYCCTNKNLQNIEDRENTAYS